MNKIVSFLVPFLLMFMGCATPTPTGTPSPYKKCDNNFNGGYLEKKLAEDIYQVMFLGNSYTEIWTVHDFALLRAAEIGRELGYSHLRILRVENLSRTSVIDMGSHSYTTGSVNFGMYSGTTRTYNDQMTLFYPGISIWATYYKSEPEGIPVGIQRVDTMISTMEVKYGLKLNTLKETP